MEVYPRYSQERGERLEKKFRTSRRALRVAPELSRMWKQNTILHISLSEQKMSVQIGQKTRVKIREIHHDKDLSCKSTKPISCSDTEPVWGHWAGMCSSCHGPGHADPSEHCQQTPHPPGGKSHHSFSARSRICQGPADSCPGPQVSTEM